MSRQIREIRVRDLVCYYLLTLIILLVLTTAFVLLEIYFEILWVRLVLAPAYLVVTYYPMKFHAIGLVLVYKAFAPMEMRDRCRFEPTCSTYMIMAIQKFGLYIGVIKGIKRILRCKPPNGGVDYP